MLEVPGVTIQYSPAVFHLNRRTVFQLDAKGRLRQLAWRPS